MREKNVDKKEEMNPAYMVSFSSHNFSDNIRPQWGQFITFVFKHLDRKSVV
jgi:hypothetical protein